MDTDSSKIKGKTFTFRIRPEIWQAMQKIKAERGVTYTAQLILALDSYYRQLENNK